MNLSEEITKYYDDMNWEKSELHIKWVKGVQDLETQLEEKEKEILKWKDYQIRSMQNTENILTENHQLTKENGELKDKLAGITLQASTLSEGMNKVIEENKELRESLKKSYDTKEREKEEIANFYRKKNDKRSNKENGYRPCRFSKEYLR